MILGYIWAVDTITTTTTRTTQRPRGWAHLHRSPWRRNKATDGTSRHRHWPSTWNQPPSPKWKRAKVTRGRTHLTHSNWTLKPLPKWRSASTASRPARPRPWWAAKFQAMLEPITPSSTPSPKRNSTARIKPLAATTPTSTRDVVRLVWFERVFVLFNMTNLNVDRYSTFATTAASSLSCAPTAPFSTRRSSSATGGSTSTAPRPPTFTTSTPRLESSQKSRPPQLPTEVVSPCPSLHQSWTRNRWPIPIWSTCHLWKWPSSPSRPNHPPRPTFRPTQPKPCLTASSPRPRRLPLRVTYPRTIIKVYYNQSSSQNKKKQKIIYSRHHWATEPVYIM